MAYAPNLETLNISGASWKRKGAMPESRQENLLD